MMMMKKREKRGATRRDGRLAISHQSSIRYDGSARSRFTEIRRDVPPKTRQQIPPISPGT